MFATHLEKDDIIFWKIGIKSLKQSKISNMIMNKKFKGSVRGTIYMASKREKLLLPQR